MVDLKISVQQLIFSAASIGADAFTLSVYPASTPDLYGTAKNGVLADLLGDRCCCENCILRSLLWCW